MSEKSMWRGFGQFVSNLGGSGSKPMTTIEQRCPAGKHQVDSQWTKCPYCEAEQGAAARSAAPAQPSIQAAAPSPPSRRSTLIDSDPLPRPAPGTAAAGPAFASSGQGRRHTMVDAGPVGEARLANAGRRIMGILTTFTWSRLGDLYPIRDGRNYAGSGVVSSDNNTPCEILVSDDSLMSSAHFLILCQNGRFIISDNLSTNGTFLNGEQIDTRGVELPDDAVIKAGATVFVFQKVHLARTLAAGAEAGGGAGADDRTVADRDPRVSDDY